MQINVKIITFISIECAPSSSDIYQTAQTKYHTAVTHAVFEKKYELIYSYSKRQVSGCELITTRKGPSPFLSHEEEKQLQSTCMRWPKYGYFLKSDLFTDRNL